MTKWEYILTSSWSDVQKYGRDGWELVAVTDASLSSSTWYYLKRPIED